MLNKGEIYDLVLLEGGFVPKGTPFEEKIEEYEEHLTKKFDVNKDTERFLDANQKFFNNSSLRGQFKKRIDQLSNGTFHNPSPKKGKVRRSQRKRGYHDKGTMAPIDQRVRKGIDQREVVPVDLLEEANPFLLRMVLRHLPNKRFTETTKEGISFIWLDELELTLQEKRYTEDFTPYKYQLLQELDYIYEDYNKDFIRKYFKDLAD